MIVRDVNSRPMFVLSTVATFLGDLTVTLDNDPLTRDIVRQGITVEPGSLEDGAVD